MSRVSRLLVAVFSVAVLFSGWTKAAYSLSQKDILLYVPFEDGTADAEIAAGNPKAIERGKSKFAEGKIGQGYLSGQAGDELLYDTKDNINIASGTIALWVKPLGWGENDTFFRFWFRVGETAGGGGDGRSRPTSFLWFYKSPMAPLIWLVEQHYRQPATTLIHAGKDAYAPGPWTHIVATWCGPVMRLYVNGQYKGYVRTATPTIMKNFGSDMFFGGGSWTAAGATAAAPDSVIDEAYVLKRPLTSGEVKQLYEKGKDAFTDTGAAPAEAELSLSYLPSDETLKVNLMVNGRAPGDTAGLSAVFSVLDSSGNATPVNNVLKEVKSVDMSDYLDVKNLPVGKYKVSVVLKSGAASSPPAFADFEKSTTPEWLGNKIGYPTTVPKPWTPLVRKADTLSCLNRTVTYGDSMFPVQITSLKQNLLARPITLLVRKDGKLLPGQDFRITWGKTTPLRIDFTVQGTYEDIPVNIEGYMEFDGFIWTKLTIPKVAGASLDGLALEIPLLPEIATLQHAPIKVWAQEPKNGKVFPWNCAIIGSPFVWLGNEEVGLQWATEDIYDWANADPDKTIELIPGEKECLLRVTMIDHSIPLDRPREYRLAFHPTPVKPMPKDFRSYDMKINGPFWRDMLNNTKLPSVPDWALGAGTWNIQTLANDWFPGYPAVGPYAWQSIDGLNARGIKPMLYWDVEQLWRGIPEYAAFRTEWNPKNPAALPFETSDGSTIGSSLRTVPSFRDWAVWRVHKSLADYPWIAPRISGFYLDVVQGFWGAEPRTDSQGNVLTRHEWMGTRELQKRVYVMLQNEWPGLRIMNHQSSDTHMPELAFAHMSITGENTAVGKEGGYQHVMDLDSCRAELTSAKWGIPIVYLPEFQTSGLYWPEIMGPKGIPNCEHLTGLLFVHDVIPWPVFTNSIPFARLTGVKSAFGWDEQTEFIGYWRKDNPVKLETAASPVVVSVYKRPGKALLVIMNNSDQDAQVTATVDWKKLGVAVPSELVDAYTVTGVPAGEVDMGRCSTGRAGVLEPKTYLKRLTVPVQGATASFTVKKRNFRVLTTE